MIQLSGIDHINMRVENLEKSLSFYNQLFGFSVKESGTRNGNPYAILGLPDKAYLCLYEVPGASLEDNEQLRINHFGFHVANFAETEALLREHNVPIHYGGAVQQGNSLSLYIEDPSGHEIELAEKFGGDLK